MSDDLLAVAAGLTSGIERIAVPYFQASYQDRLLQAREKRALKQKEALNAGEREARKVELDEFTAPELKMKPGKYDPELLKVMGAIAGKEPKRRKVLISEDRAFQLEKDGKLDPKVDYEVFGKKDTKKEAGLEALIRETADNLPKMRASASSQKTNIQSINRALSLVKTGNVTGKGGQLRSFLAPYAEFAGANTEGMDEAQTFQLLTRVIVGPMRLDIIGPGPVSEWEQKLMQQISGGGGSAKAAAKELLSTYKRLAQNKVNEYNEAATNSYTLSPRFKDLYKPIEMEEEDPEKINVPRLGAGRLSSDDIFNDILNKRKSAAP